MRRRTRIVLALLVLLAALSSYTLHRGLRYPPPQWDPGARATTAGSINGWRIEADGAYVRTEAGDPEDGRVRLRAFVPEPWFRLRGTRGGTVRLVIENVHPEAVIVGPGTAAAAFTQERSGLERHVAFELPFGAMLDLRVVFPARQNYRFAAFGDAGGRTALRWGLQRAAELGADFVLHVGDFYYADGDVEGAAAALRDAAVPVYAAIGNHDFHGGHRNRHREFTDAIGPRNAYFALGGVLFANLDTAADTVPAGAGRRGDVLAALPGRASLMTLDAPTPLVVFTHRPLDDPRVVDGSREASHALNRRAEAEWLRDFVLGVGDVDWIAGHVHASHAFEHDGLRQWVAGDGLGLRGEQARILVGDWTPGGAVSLRFEPLAMPAVTLAQVLAENPDR